MDVERLTHDLDALREYCDVTQSPAGAEVCRQAADALAKLQAERDEAREALRPFAEAWDDCGDEADKDSWCAWESPLANCVTFGHFRAASRALGGGE